MAKQIRVGIIVAVAILLVVFGLRWLASWRVGRTGYHVELHFEDAGGLKRGDRVLVYGVYKGRVNDVWLTERGVLVKVWLESDVVLREDASAEIESVGILGAARVLLHPGESERLHDFSKPMEGVPGVDLRKLVSKASEILERTGDLVHTISDEFRSKDLAGRTDRILSNLDVATRDLKSSVAQMKSLLGDNRETLNQTIDRIDSLTQDVDSLLTDLKGGKGTAGKLLSDEALYEETVAGIKELRELIQDIKKNPRRYFRLF